jgi:hypothetical protein
MKQGLFFHGHATSFVLQDLVLLKRQYAIQAYKMKMPKNPILLSWAMFKSFLFTLKRIRKVDFVYCWFCDYHAYLPLLLAKIFKKKSFIVIGGYDAARNDALAYGAHRKKWRSKIIKHIGSHADVFLAVSPATLEGIKTYFGAASLAKSTLLYNGVDTDGFMVGDEIKRTGFIAIYSADSIQRLRIKGGDFLVEVARNMPQHAFTVVGVNGEAADYLNAFQLSNLMVMPPSSIDEIKKLLQSKKIYLQFSRIESFGIALVEGVLSGCIPIGYSIPATADIIQNPKLLFDELSLESFKKVLSNLPNISETEITNIRQRCLHDYSLKKREQQLINQIS